MRRPLLAAILSTLLAMPAYSQTAAPPAPGEAEVTAQVEEIPVPEDAPRGSSSPTATGVGIGVGAIVVVFGIAALGAAFAMGGS
jgi:hypothetical protein